MNKPRFNPNALAAVLFSFTLAGCDGAGEAVTARWTSVFSYEQPIAVIAPQARMQSAGQGYSVTGTDNCPKGSLLAILPDFPQCVVVLPKTKTVTAYVQQDGSGFTAVREILAVQFDGDQIRLRRPDGALLSRVNHEN